MINLKLLVPEATTNYITNPAFRYGTTGWNVQGATLTRSLDYARFGIASGKVVTAGAAQREGVYFRVSALAGISEPVTVSIYLRGEGKVRLRLDNNVAGGNEFPTSTIELIPDRWTRHEVTGFSTGGNDMRLWVESDDTVARAYTFYVDGAQMERKPYSTSYCDGDQPGCRWNITSHASLSTRTADTRKGGRWIALAGPCRPDNDIYATLLGGFGMPPVQNQTQSWAQVPGSYYQNQKILDRVVTMSFHVKDENLRATPPANLKNLHDLRQQLVDLFKSDVTLNDEPFLFEYSETEADRPLYIEFRYEAGLEGSWDVRNGWFNSFILRLLAVDPLFKEDNQNVYQLNTRTTYNANTPTSAYPLWAKIGEQWTSLLNQYLNVECFAESPDGTIYIGTNSTTTGFVYKYDGISLTIIGTAVGTNIFGMDVGADGTLYVVGDFSSINGVSANNIARRNPTTGTWSAMGTGLGARGETVCVAQNGQVYAGGSFTTAGGISCLRIARWDGQWRTVGATSGVNQAVNTIVRGRDNRTIYMGGSFTQSNGGSVTYNYVASIDIVTNLISRMGYGLSGGSFVNSMDVGLDGIVYAAGSFTGSGSPGTATLTNIAQWSGGNLWKPLGSGINGVIDTVAVGLDGEVLVGGYFTLAGTVPLLKQARWFENTWNSMEIDIGANNGSVISALMVTKQGDVFLGASPISGSVTYLSTTPAYNTILNSGSASVYPKMYILGQGTVRFIGNIKTGRGIYLNLPVLSGEEVFVDFARGTIESTSRGSLLYSILSGSEIRSINLLPGDNSLGIYITDDVSCIAQIQYTPQHWSVDAVVDAEAMV